MPSYQVLGKPTARVDGVEKVTGTALYSADFAPSGTIWGKSLLSPYSHARIVSIDTSAARALPGVHAVLTGADVAGQLWGRAIKDIPVLAQGRVRFAGERVAAVAADDEDIAQQAIDLIDVVYEELPTVFEIEDALADDAPVLHADFPSYVGGAKIDLPPNGYHHVVTDRGDLEAGFADADLIVENTYRTKRVHQGYLEPQSVLVSIDGDGDGAQTNVWACSKAPYNTREALANGVGVEEDTIVFNHTYIGGDFGGKATPANLPIAYELAKASGRPVRMVLDYLVEEFMAANPRHSTMTRLRTGVKKDGTIVAHHVQFFVNVGAYAGYKPGRVIGGANQAAGPYRVGNVRVEATHVYSNLVPGGHMRAPGTPQALFALESHIDEVAGQVGMDPLAFRLKNLVQDGETAATGATRQHSRVRQTLQAAADGISYKNPKAKGVGRGFAVGEHAPGGGQGTSRVTLQPGGEIELMTPIFDQGTGTYTILTQVVAEELQVPPEQVHLSVWPTGALEFDSGIGGSRGARVATVVSHAAAQDAIAKLLQLAAEHFGCAAEVLVLRNGEIRRLDTEEAVRWPAFLTELNATVIGEASADERGAAQSTGYCAQAAEVYVDEETGEVKLLNFVSAHDVGLVLNPLGHTGQINGGFVQGLGYALMEELAITDGHVTSLSFGDYKFPTTMDLPPIKTVLLEADEGVGPYAIKGIGENSNISVAPAIANAVADALGVRIRELPITSEKVYRALKAR
jgi:CO/xanthine dehydrogenase Mo-binding subunit